MNKFFLAALLLTFSVAGAQTLAWGGRFGGSGEDVVLAMHTDAQGNTYTTGYFTYTADFDLTDQEYLLTTNIDFEIFLQKTAPDGSLLWAKSMGGQFGDYGTKIATDSSGNVYLTGVFQDTGDFDPGVGEFLLTATGSLDVFILKLSANGEFMWAKHFEGTDYEESNGIGIDSQDNVYVSGYFYAELDFDPNAGQHAITPSAGDGFLVKLTKDGSFIWAQAIGGPDFDLVTGMQTLPNGNVLLSGNFRGTVDFDPSDGIVELSADNGYDGIFVYQTNQDGDLLKATKVAQVENGGYGLSVAGDSQGNVFVTGYLNGQGTFETAEGTVVMTPIDFVNGYVAKINTDGSVAWARHLAGTGVTTGYIVAVNSHDDVLVNGYFNGTMTVGAITLTEESNLDTESFVVKLHNDGQFVWGTHWGGINTVDRSAMSIDPQDNILVGSAFEGTVDLDPGAAVLTAQSVDFRDMFLVKLTDESLAVAEHSTKPRLRMYPNPVTDRLYIDGIEAAAEKQFALYDALGRAVKNGTLSAEGIDTGALTAGVYHLVTGGQSYKIIKQ
ncbi:SBBP repeat-containing protein [Flavobacterium caeni]|uniref:Por secretion system C-terminal sorting domain-containing protein n=1 Tax=Flavobacterium caeni TaxID=490189 RepID=A0A1G5E3Z0_9FLAO|nr:SBBP repeat-containing protein [Flavobacterium caeni]SCY21617.1 Por secretion system C-terminal sorting domain-containing protein [Flavobacterium caeni]